MRPAKRPRVEPDAAPTYDQWATFFYVGAWWFGKGKGKASPAASFFPAATGDGGEGGGSASASGKGGSKGKLQRVATWEQQLEWQWGHTLTSPVPAADAEKLPEEDSSLSCGLCGCVRKIKARTEDKERRGPFFVGGCKDCWKASELLRTGQGGTTIPIHYEENKKVEVVLKGLFFFLKNQLSISNPTL